MSTRSRIGLKTSGRIYSIFCHWDGYPGYNGRILLEHYQEPGKIRQLLSLGSLSVLGVNPNAPPDYMTFDSRMNEDVRKKVGDYCVSIIRDRFLSGESDGVGWQINDCMPVFHGDKWDGDEEFSYLWDGEKWLVNEMDGAGWVELTMVIIDKGGY